jgi:hypothetical protein
MKKIGSIVVLTLTGLALAAPVIPMNKALNALLELVPYLTDAQKFNDKKNEGTIRSSISKLEEAFNAAKHHDLLKQDVFSPSLGLIKSSITDSKQAFSKGNKDYAHWRMREITAQCMDCHTRLPADHVSSFRDGMRQLENAKFSDPYNLGVGQMIVRLYPEAKATFTKVIDEKFIRGELTGILLPMKQLLLIQTKILKDPEQMVKILDHYETKKGLSLSDKEVMKQWRDRLVVWGQSPYNKNKLKNDTEVESFIKSTLKPLFKNDSLYIGKFDVDLMYASGLLSNFIFENPQSKFAPDAIYWIGLSDKYLQREQFVGSGELFLKECVRRYPKSAIAPKCFAEYKESMEFQFTGSRGTELPAEVERELDHLESLIKKK